MAGPAYDIRAVSCSPDGKRIAFCTQFYSIFRDGIHWYVNLMNADGSGKVRRPSLQPNYAAVWSPAGTEIAYEGPDHRCHVLSADGNDRQLIRPDGRPTGPWPSDPMDWQRTRCSWQSARSLLGSNFSPYWQPSWSLGLHTWLSSYPSVTELWSDGTKNVFTFEGTGPPLRRAWVFVVMGFCGVLGPLAVSCAVRSYGGRAKTRPAVAGAVCGGIATTLFIAAIGTICIMLFGAALSELPMP